MAFFIKMNMVLIIQDIDCVIEFESHKANFIIDFQSFGGSK
jgi:hypothetical protein